MTSFKAAQKARLLPVALFGTSVRPQAEPRKRVPGTALWTVATVAKASQERTSGEGARRMLEARLP